MVPIFKKTTSVIIGLPKGMAGPIAILLKGGVHETPSPQAVNTENIRLMQTWLMFWLLGCLQCCVPEHATSNRTKESLLALTARDSTNSK